MELSNQLTHTLAHWRTVLHYPKPLGFLILKLRTNLSAPLGLRRVLCGVFSFFS